MALLKSNVAEFNTKILAWGKMHKSGITMNTIVRKLLLDGLTSVTNYTPVKTGYLRYNWTVTIGRPTSEKFGDENSRYSQPQNLEAQAKKAPKAGYNVHYIQNNANYAEPVNNGTPRMEARQMVELAMGDLIMSVNESGVMAV